MLIIDFAKLNRQRLSITMADMGMTNFNELSFLAVLERLDLGSDRVSEERFPVWRSGSKVDLSESIQSLRQQKQIVDAIGPTKVSSDMPICFSTIIGDKPKEYLKQYLEVAKVLCKQPGESQFVVWIEDTLTVLKKGWDTLTLQRAVDAHKAFFQHEFPSAQVLLSSEVAPFGIPQYFAEKISVITLDEFLTVLPFHLRNPMFVKTLDVVHFVWNCYTLFRLPGVYLAGVNNKRHFELFRKAAGRQITAILLPLQPENIISCATEPATP